MNAAASTELTTLWSVVERLTTARMPYFLTGSLALNFYGQVRATNDIDIVIQMAPAAAQRVYDLFQDRFYVSLEAIQEALQHGTMFNIIDNTTVFKVDLIIAQDNARTEQQFLRSRVITVGDHMVSVIAPEDLILAKLEWARDSGSTMQARDILNILRTLGDALDMPYLRQWADRQKVRERLEELYAQR